MKKIILNPRVENLFRLPAAGAFDHLWGLDPSQVISQQRTSDVAVITLPGPSGTSIEVFRKRYWYRRIQDRLKGALRNTFLGMSRAAREFRHLERLCDQGCSRVRPVGCGEERTLRLLSRAFILTEKLVNTQTLEQVVGSSEFAAAPLEERRRLAARLGNWVRTLHDRGFRDRDLFVRNILVHCQGKAIAFSKIDSGAGTGGLGVPGGGRYYLRDLGDLNRDVASTVTRQDRMRFLLSYLAAPRVDREVRGLVDLLAGN
jgi:hypothetical protein